MKFILESYLLLKSKTIRDAETSARTVNAPTRIAKGSVKDILECPEDLRFLAESETAAQIHNRVRR
jgi:hypothetical protein